MNKKTQHNGLKILKKCLLRFLLVWVLAMIVGWIFIKLIDNKYEKDSKAHQLVSGKNTPDYCMKRYFTNHSDDGPHTTSPDDPLLLIDVKSLYKSNIEMARMLDLLGSYEPAVIGLDILFADTSSFQEDSCLVEAIKYCGKNSKVVLPYYRDDYDSVRAPFFVNDLENENFLKGSVNFDNPWDFKSNHGTDTSFVYLIAESYLSNENRKPDTSNLLVDYTPRRFRVVEYCVSDTGRLFKDRSDIFEEEKVDIVKNDIEGKIVMVGALDRDIDPLLMDFPVRYGKTEKRTDSTPIQQLISRRIPGLIALSYQVKSLISDCNEQIIKASEAKNLFWNGFVLFVYLMLFYMCVIVDNAIDNKIANTGEKSVVKNKAVLSMRLYKIIAFFLPLLRMSILFGAEYILLDGWLLDIIVERETSSNIMPNLMMSIVSLPFVNGTDIFVEKVLKYLRIMGE